MIVQRSVFNKVLVRRFVWRLLNAYWIQFNLEESLFGLHSINRPFLVVVARSSLVLNGFHRLLAASKATLEIKDTVLYRRKRVIIRHVHARRFPLLRGLVDVHYCRTFSRPVHFYSSSSCTRSRSCCWLRSLNFVDFDCVSFVLLLTLDIF
jgi:hypothetical protein